MTKATDAARGRALPCPAELFRIYRPNSTKINEPGWIAAELRRLANNNGEARLWAGVHWISDHRAGRAIGRAAAEAVIAKFRANCVSEVDIRTCPQAAQDGPPSDAMIRAMFKASCDDTIPPKASRGRALVTKRGGF